MPLMKGRIRLMATPRIRDHAVGGLYRIRCGDSEEDGGDEEISSPVEYCSLSECIVMPDSASGLCSSEAMMLVKRRR
jgi:hypothetical protein